ncbi:hypothetical protein K3495_g8596 [Podosphaera aphanis]|nr:hypothetical protein K3495_g8596 [Podosphaera aphanis]
MTGPASSSVVRPKSHSSTGSQERVPLLSQTDGTHPYDESRNIEEHTERPPSTLAKSLNRQDKRKKCLIRWPTITAIVFLGLLTVMVMFGVFIAPATIKIYANEALSIEPSRLTINSVTDSGVTAHVQAEVKINASRVQDRHVRDIGRLGTWVARKIEVQGSNVDMFLPEFGNMFIGTVMIPSVVLDVRNNHNTKLDFSVGIDLGDIAGLQRFVRDAVRGRLNQVRILGKAKVSLKSGIISLGTQSISKMMIFQGGDMLKIPRYDLTKLSFSETPTFHDGHHGITANVSISVENKYPVELNIPAIWFEILIPDCDRNDLIKVENIIVNPNHVYPYQRAIFEAGTVIRDLAKPILQTCPGHGSSPLEIILNDFIHQKNVTVFIRGSKSSESQLPGWISRIISNITVPVSFPGQTLDGVIKNFSITDTKFSPPDIFADPGSEEADPHISGRIEATVHLPKSINFNFNVSKARATSQVFYKQQKLGDLNIMEWQEAESKLLEDRDVTGLEIKIWTYIENARLKITDRSVFSRLFEALLLEGNTVTLEIKALVDIQVSTVLGEFVTKKLPAEGSIPVLGTT